MPSPEQMAAEFQNLHEYLSTESDPSTAQQRLVELACTVIPGCRWAAITVWPSKKHPRTIAATGDVSRMVDDIQYQTGEGPCLSAAAENWTAWSPDLSQETRWPTFVARAISSTPVRGVLSFHLSGRPEQSHALNLYSGRPGLFAQNAVASGTLFASHAAVLLSRAEAAADAAHLRVALTSSRQIGVAIGMLRATYGLPGTGSIRRLAAHQ